MRAYRARVDILTMESISMSSFKLFTKSNTKTMKGEAAGHLTLILHLAPGDISGQQVCPKATAGCLAACLNTAGRGRFDSTQAARIRKTRELFADRAGFMAKLVADIQAGIRKAAREGLRLCVRLNGTSDLPWEKFRAMVNGTEFRNLFEAFPDVQFYDYTKISARAVKSIASNYSLTFSRSEANTGECVRVAQEGGNIAVVFAGDLPETFLGLPVVVGDEADLRFLDPRNVVVGLTAKGSAKRDASGFVVRPITIHRMAA